MLKNQETNYYPNEIATLLQLTNCVINQPQKLKIADNQQKDLVLARRYPNIVCCGILLATLQRLNCKSLHNVFNNLIPNSKIRGTFPTVTDVNNARLFANTFNADWDNTISDYVALARNSFPNVKLVTTKDKIELATHDWQEIITLVVYLLLSSLAYYAPATNLNKAAPPQIQYLANLSVSTLVFKFNIDPPILFRDLEIDPEGVNPFDILYLNLEQFLVYFQKNFSKQILLASYHRMFD